MLQNYLASVLVDCIKGNVLVVIVVSYSQAGKGSNGVNITQIAVNAVSTVIKISERYELAIKDFGNLTPISEQHANLSSMFDSVSVEPFYVFRSALDEALICVKVERRAGERNG